MYYPITAEQSKELRKAMKREKNARIYRKMETVALRGEGKKNEEIVGLTGYHYDVIGRLCKEYLETGLEEFRTEKRKGGNNRNLSEDEEKAFLAQFEKAAEAGQIITVNEIAAAYDKQFGKEHKSKSTVYYLLHKLDFRKVMPQSKHPNKASDEEIESSKKLKNK